MKVEFGLLVFLGFSMSSLAQRSKDTQLEDSLFQWQALPALNPSAYSRTFTKQQLSQPTLFAEWLRKSYVPLGALDFSYAIAEPNQKAEVQPYGTGINAAMWKPMWNNKGTAVIRQPHSENPIYIISNYIIDAEPIALLTQPGRSVFMRRSPDITKAFSGSSDMRNKFVRDLQLDKHPQIGKYLIQYYGCDGDGCMPTIAVYLSPNNKLPIRQLTRGEVLDMCESAIPSEAEKARAKIKAENRAYGVSAQDKWVNHFNAETLPKWTNGIQKLREKYKTSLSAAAELKTSNGISMIHFFNSDDIFNTEDAVKNNYNTYGIYTYEDGVLEKTQKDTTLWVCIAWKPTDSRHFVYEQEIHRSMTRHFNFDYAYDYFFGPQSAQRKPYTALNESEQRAFLDSIKRATVVVEKKQSIVGVYFWENFESTAVGQQPNGWYAAGNGADAAVTLLPGFTDKWVKLQQQRFMPEHPKGAFPENFRMEFDVATEKHFTTNTGGAFLLKLHNKLITSKNEYTSAPRQISIDLDAKAGNSKFVQNPTGYTRLTSTYTGMSAAIRHAAVLQYNNYFSNEKNRVHFTIIKSGTRVTAFIDDKEIKAVDKYGKPIAGFNELPEGTRFTSFYFENMSSQGAGVFISNIRITELKRP